MVDTNNNRVDARAANNQSVRSETEDLQDQSQRRPMEATDGESWEPDDAGQWNLRASIRRNNEAIAAFLQGRLVHAHRLFMEASILQHNAFNDERNGSREYRCKWVNIDSTALRRLLNPSSSQNVHMSHVSMVFLRIIYEEEDEEMSETYNNNLHEMQPSSVMLAPDVILENLYWAVDFNFALTSQLLGILIRNTDDSQGMHFRALAFDVYKQLVADIVDWYDVDDGFTPLSIAILVMAIYNNQGAMFCQLKVRNQVEAYWDRMRKIWNRASHRLLGKHLICNLFQRNLEYLEATDTQNAMSSSLSNQALLQNQAYYNLWLCQLAGSINGNADGLSAASNLQIPIANQHRQQHQRDHHETDEDDDEESIDESMSSTSAGEAAEGGDDDDDLIMPANPPEIIIPPRRPYTNRDVLLGKGNTTQNHPGNIAFRQFLEGHQEEYDGAPRMVKTIVTRGLARTLMATGVRFLQQTNENVWIERSFDDVVKTISQFFRSNRKKTRNSRR